MLKRTGNSSAEDKALGYEVLVADFGELHYITKEVSYKIGIDVGLEGYILYSNDFHDLESGKFIESIYDKSEIIDRIVRAFLILGENIEIN